MAGVIIHLLRVFEEELHRREKIAQIRIKRKFLRDISDPFDTDPEYFRKHYRLTIDAARELVDLLEPHMGAEEEMSTPIHLQVLCALRFFAEGGFQKGVGCDYNHALSQTSVSRYISRVIQALLVIGNQFIHFPNTRQERQHVSERFEMYNRIPHVIGLIDCFLVGIIRPSEYEEAFYNYKASHALNVQVVCDADFIIRNIRICPGSNTDRHIYEHSEIKEQMEFLRNSNEIVEEEGQYYLIGDSGYSVSPVLSTPIVDAPAGSPEERYTNELVQVRSRIERMFGIMSHLFFSISRSRRLYYSPEKAANIVRAVCILYNFRKLRGMEDEQFDDYFWHNDDDDDDDDLINFGAAAFNYIAGVEERQRIINNYYAYD